MLLTEDRLPSCFKFVQSAKRRAVSDIFREAMGDGDVQAQNVNKIMVLFPLNYYLGQMSGVLRVPGGILLMLCGREKVYMEVWDSGVERFRW